MKKTLIRTFSLAALVAMATISAKAIRAEGTSLEGAKREAAEWVDLYQNETSSRRVALDRALSDLNLSMEELKGRLVAAQQREEETARLGVSGTAIEPATPVQGVDPQIAQLLRINPSLNYALAELRDEQRKREALGYPPSAPSTARHILAKDREMRRAQLVYDKQSEQALIHLQSRGKKSPRRNYTALEWLSGGWIHMFERK